MARPSIEGLRAPSRSILRHRPPAAPARSCPSDYARVFSRRHGSYDRTFWRPPIRVRVFTSEEAHPSCRMPRRRRGVPTTAGRPDLACRQHDPRRPSSASSCSSPAVPLADRAKRRPLTGMTRCVLADAVVGCAPAHSSCTIKQKHGCGPALCEAVDEVRRVRDFYQRWSPRCTRGTWGESPEAAFFRRGRRGALHYGVPQWMSIRPALGWRLRGATPSAAEGAVASWTANDAPSASSAWQRTAPWARACGGAGVALCAGEVRAVASAGPPGRARPCGRPPAASAIAAAGRVAPRVRVAVGPRGADAFLARARQRR